MRPKTNNCEGEHFEKPWKAAKDFSEILNLNRKFLLGEISQTPYHGGPVDDETLPLIKGLLELHDFGLLTEDSQPFEHLCGRDENDYFEYEQRPYVSFLVSNDNDQVLKFFEMLKNRSEIMTCATEPYSNQTLSGSHKQRIGVTRERVAKTVERLKETPWRDVTWCFGDWNRAEEEICRLSAVKKSKVLWFYIFGREWGVALDLVGLILELVVKSALPRDF